MRATVSALAVLSLLTGCESWKRADATAGTALSFNVGTVKVDGRTLIRMRARRTAVWIDPRGGAVVDYRFQDAPKWFWEPDPKDSERQRQHVIEGAVGPNALAGPGWRTACTPSRPELDTNAYWQVDSASHRLVLLSDAKRGLRWRKTFYLSDQGDLYITVQLENVGGIDEPIGAASEIATVGAMAVEGAVQHAWADGQWFSRQLTDSPEGTPGTTATTQGVYTFAPRKLGWGKHLQWSEHWWLSRASSATQPAGKPPTPTRLEMPQTRPAG